MRATIRTAKRDWAERVLADATNNVDHHALWSVAKWRKGRSNPIIPPIRSLDGGLSTDHETMALAFRDRFFPRPKSLPPVAVSQPDDPVNEDEVRFAITDTSNSSAPGPSGVSYKFIKWAFAAHPELFVGLFNLCLDGGAHPWKDAKVVVLPKPSRPDYSAPKAYRPIALLECLGKLLEKIVARRIMDESNAHGLISSHQFGSRDYHCAVDAAAVVVHNAEGCLHAKWPGVLLSRLTTSE